MNILLIFAIGISLSFNSFSSEKYFSTTHDDNNSTINDSYEQEWTQPRSRYNPLTGEYDTILNEENENYTNEDELIPRYVDIDKPEDYYVVSYPSYSNDKYENISNVPCQELKELFIKAQKLLNESVNIQRFIDIPDDKFKILRIMHKNFVNSFRTSISHIKKKAGIINVLREILKEPKIVEKLYNESNINKTIQMWVLYSYSGEKDDSDGLSLEKSIYDTLEGNSHFVSVKGYDLKSDDLTNTIIYQYKDLNKKNIYVTPYSLLSATFKSENVNNIIYNYNDEDNQKMIQSLNFIISNLVKFKKDLDKVKFTNEQELAFKEAYNRSELIEKLKEKNIYEEYHNQAPISDLKALLKATEDELHMIKFLRNFNCENKKFT
jgi:hypothetical protein